MSYPAKDDGLKLMKNKDSDGNTQEDEDDNLDRVRGADENK